jgi:predicted metal-dependent hydrolase
MSDATHTSFSPVPARVAVAGLEFEVQVSAGRNSIGITVDRDGSLILSAPQDCGEKDLAAFAYEKRLWVYRKLAEKDLMLSARPVREFVTGEGFSYLGRSHRLLLHEGAPMAVKLERGRLIMRPEIAASRRAGAAIVDWYRSQALRWLPRRVEPWAERMGVQPSLVDVRDLGYRWGSLGKNERVNFHWATIQLAPSLIDYVIVHELAHVHEPNHTRDFWLLVERAMPEYQAMKSTLAAVGSQLWLGQPGDLTWTRQPSHKVAPSGSLAGHRPPERK